MTQDEQMLITPWQEKGRWYHFFIESDGTAVTLTTSDMVTATASTTALTFDANFNCIDCVVDYHNIVASTTVGSVSLKTSSLGKQYIALLGAAKYSSVDVWAFGYYK